MNIIRHLSVVAALGSLVGCTAPGIDVPTMVSGQITRNSATNPKLAIVTAEGDTFAVALAEAQAMAGKGTPENKLPLSSVVKPKADGTYTLEIKGTKPETLFYVYGWDDLDDNDKVNGAEALMGKTSENASFYIYYKSKAGTKEVKSDDSVVPLASKYDWTF